MKYRVPSDFGKESDSDEMHVLTRVQLTAPSTLMKNDHQGVGRGNPSHRSRRREKRAPSSAPNRNRMPSPKTGEAW